MQASCDHHPVRPLPNAYACPHLPTHTAAAHPHAQLSITRGELNTGFGTQQREFDINRTIQLVYLDGNLRIARFLPNEDGEDGEGACGGGARALH